MAFSEVNSLKNESPILSLLFFVMAKVKGVLSDWKNSM